MNEENRLAALRRYGVLDTLPEPVLDDLTTLAAHLCQTPIALIALIDEDRQWFKSRVGLPAGETPRNIAFCAHTIQQPDLLTVPDATLDARFADNPLVTGDPNIRFYAGVPLVNEEGYALGTLCVIDRQPRQLTPVQQEALHVLGRQAMAQLELRRQTREVAERERLLRAVFDAEPECVKLLGADGRLQMMNRAGLQIIEAESWDQVAGQCIYPLVAPEHRAKFEELSARVFRGESGTMEFQITGLKGTPRWLAMHAAPLRDGSGAVTAVLGITRDITEKRQREHALAASEVRYRRLFETAKDGILILNAETGMVDDVNPFLVSLLGYSHDQFLGKTIWDLGFFNDVVANEAKFAELREKEYVRYENLPLETSTGGRIEVEFVSNAYGVDGTRVIQCNVRDVTERKHAEARMREQAAMLDQAHDAIIVRDMHTRRITFWNQGAQRLYGWSADEAIGRDVGELIFSDPTVPDTVSAELLRAGEWRGENRQMTKAGKPLTVSSHVTLLRDAEGTPASVLVINFDITGQKELEARLLRAQRMESIGTLASGLAHDLNNILAPIMMSAPFLRRDLPAKLRERIVSTIEISAERGAQIVRQVLTFGRGVDGEKCPVQIATLIEELMKIMLGTFPKDLAVKCSVDPQLWPVIGDATQLHQVLLNLCLNARDAMPAGGTLRLRAANLDLDASYASMLPEATPGRHVRLEVSDTGGGIPPEVLERIFDPFFTTKEVGKGTGLGLATAHGIVRNHGGFIHVETQPGKGTTFQVWLPASPDRAAASPDAPRPQIPQGRGELVLVVDDEEAVRNAARLTLEAGGYRVLTAADGTAALAEFAMNSGSVAAVLTDLRMPFMDGVALVRALRTMAPALPIIASTGLGEQAQLAQLKAQGVETVLHKPYGAAALLGAVHAVIHPALHPPTP